MTDSDCALCQLAATPIAERETKTFFTGYLFKCWAGLGKLEVVDDMDSDAGTRLLCYATEHVVLRERRKAVLAGDGYARVRSMMAMVLECVANAAFGEGNWDFYAMCSEHGWHCHARKRG